MFVVAGVSGKSGSAAARALVSEDRNVRGLTRDGKGVDVPGVEPFKATLDDVEALTRAFMGAEGAYVLCPTNPKHPDPIQSDVSIATAVAQAAKATNLPKLVLLSSLGAQLPSGTGVILGLHKAEEILADAAPHVTFLRAAGLMDDWSSYVDVARGGTLPSFVADLDAPSPTISTKDIGRIAATLLMDPLPPRVVELEGPQRYSVRDVAAGFARAFGQSVQPVFVPAEQWRRELEKLGFSNAFVELMMEMYTAINNGQLHAEGVADQRKGTVTIDSAIEDWIS